VNVLVGDIARVSCMPQWWNFLMISTGCNTCHVRDMRDIGMDAGIPYVMQKAVQQQMEIISSTLSMKKYILIQYILD
jgi:hypothetical protein